MVENKQNDAISFGSSVEGTKAMEKTSTWVDGDMIGVHAFIKDGALAADFEANFMNNETITYTTPNWAYTNTKYWPNNSTEMLSFVAYYPSSTMANSSVTSAPTVTLGAVTIPFEVKSDPAEQHDLLGGAVVDADKDNRDGAGSAITTGNTSIEMNHLLSKIVFAIKTNGDYTGATVRLKKIMIEQVKGEGNFILDNTFASPSWNTTAAMMSNYTAYDMATGIGQVVTDTEAMVGTYADNGLMMIPQTLSATAKLVIDYEVIYTSPALVVDETKEVMLNTTTATEWEMNKMYTYKIGIGLDAITFDFDITAWDTPGSDITI